LQGEQQQKHDLLRKQGVEAPYYPFASSESSSGQPGLHQEVHLLYLGTSLQGPPGAERQGDARSSASAHSGGSATLRSGVNASTHMRGRSGRQGLEETQQVREREQRREQPDLSEGQQVRERQQLSGRLQESGLKGGKDAWDAALIDAYSTASLMLLAPPLLVRRREAALKCRSQRA